MTTLAVKNGVMAADSRVTVESENGVRTYECEKLFRKKIVDAAGDYDVIIGLAGESTPGLLFLDWYGSSEPAPTALTEGEAEFTALILTPHGLFEADAYCRPERVLNDPHAVGSGAPAAMGAMLAGATAAQAVAISCRVDIYSALPVTTMRLTNVARRGIKKAEGLLSEKPRAVAKGKGRGPSKKSRAGESAGQEMGGGEPGTSQGEHAPTALTPKECREGSPQKQELVQEE